MTAAEKLKKNLTAWVPAQFKDRVIAFIKKFNNRPENLKSGRKMTLTEFIIMVIDEYMKKRGG